VLIVKRFRTAFQVDLRRPLVRMCEGHLDLRRPVHAPNAHRWRRPFAPLRLARRCTRLGAAVLSKRSARLFLHSLLGFTKPLDRAKTTLEIAIDRSRQMIERSLALAQPFYSLDTPWTATVKASQFDRAHLGERGDRQQ